MDWKVDLVKVGWALKTLYVVSVLITASWAMTLTDKFSGNSGAPLPYIAYCAVPLAGTLLSILLRNPKGKKQHRDCAQRGFPGLVSLGLMLIV